MTEGVRRGAPPTPGGPLGRPEFRAYFTGNLISNSGTWLQNVALGVYMLDLTHSSFWVGLASAALFVPILLLALPAGALADRGDRLRLLMRSQLAAGGIAVVLTVLVATGSANRYAVVALAALAGVSTAVAIPSMQSMIPSLVPAHELDQAIGLNALTFNLARVLGPILAAVTITGLGAVWAFGLNAASYLALVGALLVIGRLPFPRDAGGPPGSVGQGLSYAWRHPLIRTMLLAIVAIGISLDPITTLSPALAESYGLKTGGAGWIVSAWGGGAVLGITAGGRLARHVARRGLGWTGLLALAAGMAALGGARSLAQAVPAGMLTGAGYIVATMAFTTAIQSAVAERLRGRVMALWTIAFLGPRTFAAVVDGALADALGPRVAAACFAAPALLAAWFVRRTAPPPGEPIAPAA
jgi:MFS family permease